MSYRALLTRMSEENSLHSVLLELGYGCNLDCVFCYNHPSPQGKPLREEQYLALLADLADMQVLNLVLSGGEPLTSPVFWPIGRRGRELGFVLRIKSNGHALDLATARRLKSELGPYIVDLSLHGAQAQTHDRQTQVPGSFDRLTTNIEGMLEAGLRLRLQAVLTRWNEAEIEDMFALARRLGVPLSVAPIVSPRDDGSREALALAPSREGVRRLFEVLAEQPQGEGSLSGAGFPSQPDLTRNCGAGASTLTVDPCGNVYPCVQWRRPVGTLHEQTIRAIWERSPALDEVRRINEAARQRLQDLENNGSMVFCMGLAEQLTCDPLALYDEAVCVAEILRELQATQSGAEPP